LTNNGFKLIYLNKHHHYHHDRRSKRGQKRKPVSSEEEESEEEDSEEDEEKETGPPHWVCESCTTDNEPRARSCETCGEKKPPIVLSSSSKVPLIFTSFLYIK
jgi:hypothetical protein